MIHPVSLKQVSISSLEGSWICAESTPHWDHNTALKNTWEWEIGMGFLLLVTKENNHTKRSNVYGKLKFLSGMNYSSLCHWNKKGNRPVRNCHREVPEEWKEDFLGWSYCKKAMLFLDSSMHSMAPVLGRLWWYVFSVPPHSIQFVLLFSAAPSLPHSPLQDNTQFGRT